MVYSRCFTYKYENYNKSSHGLYVGGAYMCHSTGVAVKDSLGVSPCLHFVCNRISCSPLPTPG